MTYFVSEKLPPRVRKAAKVTIIGLLSLLFSLRPTRAADFSDVEPIIQEHCVECHDSTEAEGSLVMESFEGLMKGGESGAVIVPGKSAESLLIKALEGKWGKTGKNEFMPPGKRKKLTPEQIAVFKSWIDSGAPAPTKPAVVTELKVPKITPTKPPPRSIHALAFDPKSKLLAVARYGEVELVDPITRDVVRVAGGSRGAVNAVAFSRDGEFLFGAAGEPALFGEVRQWKVSDGSLVRTFQGHRDALYALAVSPDGKTLATGSYDYQIKLWNIADGTERKTISASQGAIFDLTFRNDGKLLASASADRTAKLFDSNSGERLETLGQALKEVNAVAFSPDNKRIATGGGDNRIRIYEVTPDAKEGTAVLLQSLFAHEGAILRLAYSADGKNLLSAADDKTVKLFETSEYVERLALPKQPDWPTAIAFLTEDKSVAIGRQDGSLEIYSTSDGKVVKPPAPELTRVEPRGIQRGVPTRLKLVGSHFKGLTAVKSPSDKLKGSPEPAGTNGEAWINLTAAADAPRGVYEISVVSTNGESRRVKVHVDDVPQLVWGPELQSAMTLTNLPASIWGTLNKPGETNEFIVTAHAGETLIFDLTGQRIESKGNFALTLLDEHGKPLASDDAFARRDDPFLARTFTADTVCRVRVNDAMLGGSPDHFYRLTVGALPYISGIYPLGVPANAETEVQLLGYNLPGKGVTMVKSGAAGETGLSGEAVSFRNRREIKALVNEFATPLEQEPNDTPDKATHIPLPAAVNGRLSGTSTDTDYYSFTAQKGQRLVIETAASRRGSPADTKIEVLWPDGKPVERMQLRAVRNSAITFRPEDANDSGIRFESWEEMELNDYLYANGEVMKIFRMPQGPDSDTLLYSSNGRRRPYFDTTAVGHPLDEPCYIVEPLAVGAKMPPNGLPVFHLNYENDDDCLRELGSDSRLMFTAPETGDYLVRVTDARGFGGDEYVYQLTVRESHPDFKVTLNGASPKVAPGSGQAFSVSVERMDGFDGDVRVDLLRVPKGWIASTPLIIQAGHNTAEGTLNALADAAQPGEAEWNAVGVIASAEVDGRPVIMTVNNLGQPKLAADKAKMLVKLEPITGEGGKAAPDAIMLAPGQTVRAKLTVTRNGFDEAVRFEVEDLPHGVIVDNIGLNGITFLKGENEREIFLTAAKWVGDLDRLIYAVETAVGRQTSLPLMLKVRKDGGKVATASTK